MLPRPRLKLLYPLAAAIVLCALATPADADEVADLIALVRAQPTGMENATWREQRREAVIKLGRLGDKRAVPVLLEVAENELFDVAGENAIEALGKLGDPRAVPVLQRIHADEARDRTTRQLAAKALRQLGAKPGGGDGGGGDGGGGDAGGGGGGDGRLVGGGDPILGDSSAGVKVPAGPDFPDDTLGATEAFTIAAGTAHLAYDSVRDEIVLEGNAAGRWERVVERRKMGWRLAAEAAAAGGAVKYEPDSGSRLLLVNTSGIGEGRFYAAEKIYGLVAGGLTIGLLGSKTNPPDPNNTETAFYISSDLHFAVGGGYGRILDLGEALRLRRIEKVLERQRLIGRPISGDLAEKIMRAWWALRGELGMHRRLLVTIALLREAGALLGEPDASTTYQMLEVLRDGQLTHRLDGLDIQVAVAESYLIRDDDLFLEEGRVESVLARARYGLQAASTLQEIVGEATARLRVLAPDGSPSPWSARAAATWRRFVYSDHADPIGAFEIGAEIGASDTDLPDGSGFEGVATRVGGVVGWSWIPNRASRFRLAGTAALDSGELFVGAIFEASYGFLDAVFVSRGAYDRLGSAPTPAE